jgi:lipopolysaccharide assembly protein A
MRIFSWLVRGFIFFTLFAFALNNQQNATVRWFFGVEWTAPLVIIVLAAFAAGAAIGVLAMLPGRWRQRTPSPEPAATSAARSPAGPPTVTPSDFGPEHPPREGL